MIGKTIEKYAGVLYENKPALVQDNNTSNVNETNGYLSSNSDEAKIMIATSLALLTGIIHVRSFKLWILITKISKVFNLDFVVYL